MKSFVLKNILIIDKTNIEGLPDKPDDKGLKLLTQFYLHNLLINLQNKMLNYGLISINNDYICFKNGNIETLRAFISEDLRRDLKEVFIEKGIDSIKTGNLGFSKQDGYFHMDNCIVKLKKDFKIAKIESKA